MKRRYVKLSWVCAQLVLLSACDRSSYRGGIEGSGVVTDPMAAAPTITTSGEVTALGSIVVNDVRYDLAGATITIDGLPARENDLVAGLVTVVEGDLAAGATHGVARRVTVETSVAGRISATDSALGQVTILGQAVAIDAGTIVENGVEGSPLRGLDLGRDVQVSGFAGSTGMIYATRIDSRKVSTPLLVTGRVANLDAAARTFSINGQLVSYASAALRDLPALAEGMSVRVAARALDRDTLVADEVGRRAEGLPGQPGAAAALQGMVTRFASASDFDVDGRRVSGPSSLNTVVRLDAFVFVKGSLAVGGVVAATEVQAVLPGRIVGGVTIEGVDYGLSGVMTEYGIFRLNIEEPSSGTPVLDSGLGQLVGHFTFNGRTATGTGVVIGEGCALRSAGRFCGKETAVRLEVTEVGSWIDQGSSGVIRVVTPTGETVWPLRLGYWGGRPGFDPALSDGGGSGVYELHQAEFVRASRVFMTGASDGRLFFQSADSGCTGNVTISSGSNPTNVEIEMRGCIGAFSYLNADFAGLMTRESLTPWDYDFSVLNMWVSTPAGAQSPAAMTLWAAPAE